MPETTSPSEERISADELLDLQKNFVYPGHPLTIALIVMGHYDHPDRVAEALSDNDVPGAGGAVHQALRFIEETRTSIKTVHPAAQGEAIAKHISNALLSWFTSRTVGGDFADRAADGHRQAVTAFKAHKKAFVDWIIQP